MRFKLLFAGITVLVLAIIAPIMATITTPKKLRGFYSAKFITLSLIGDAAGISMIVFSFLIS